MFCGKDITDICELDDEKSIILCLKERFKSQNIYTYVAKVLIAVNPYRNIDGLYSEEKLKSYRINCSDQLAPHLYAIADRIIQHKSVDRPQSIILTGDSGSGKTKSASHILSFLGDSSLSNQIKRSISAANFIFEQFGNASTGLNGNSSRFTKLTEMHFNPDLVSVQFSYLLLENSRIYCRNKNESNFHILHAIISAAELNKELHLNITRNYAYLSDFRVSNGSIGFEAIVRELAIAGISSEGRMQIYRILAAILHLGNVVFEEKITGKCEISELSRVHFEHSVHLLKIDQNILESALLTRSIIVSGSDEIIMDLSLSQAIKAKDCLSKILYERLFQDVVCMINANLYKQQHTQMKVKMVDIAGFESFGKNYFDQMCINYINEKIQQTFVTIMLKDEQDWYAKECLEIPIIPFLDNSLILDVFEDKSKGIFKLLDDVCKIQCQNTTNLVDNIFSFWPNSSIITMPKPSEMQQNTGFIIRHFAGAVLYDAVNFVEKNPNIGPKGIDDICRRVNLEVNMNTINNANSNDNISPSISHIKSTTTSTLKMGTADLIRKLNETECSFIRCIKPNVNQCSSVFNEDLVLSQLVSTGCIAYQQLMRTGYPSHMNFDDLFNQFKQNEEFSEYVSKNQKEFYGIVLRSCGLRWIDFRLGNKKVFLRNGKNDMLVEKLKDNFQDIINRCKRLKLLRAKWRIAIIITRLCTIWKSRPVQDDSVITTANVTAGEHLGIDEICPKMSKIRKLNTKTRCRVESRQPLKSVSTHFTNPTCANYRTTITIPSTKSSIQDKYPETITTEEHLRSLLRQERKQHSQLKCDYNKLQKRNLNLMASLSNLKAENERLVEENKKLNNLVNDAMETSRSNMPSDHNYH